MANLHWVIQQIYIELFLHAVCCVKPWGLSWCIRQTHTLLSLNSQLAELTITNCKIVILITLKSAMHDKDVWYKIK